MRTIQTAKAIGKPRQSEDFVTQLDSADSKVRADILEVTTLIGVENIPPSL